MIGWLDRWRGAAARGRAKLPLVAIVVLLAFLTNGAQPRSRDAGGEPSRAPAGGARAGRSAAPVADHAERIEALALEGRFVEALADAAADVEHARHSGADAGELATRLERMGRLKLDEGAYPDAIVLLTEAITLRRGSRPVRAIEVARALVTRGRAEKNRGLYDDALADYHEALRLTSRGGRAEDLCAAEACAGIANVIRRRPKDLPEATRWMTRSLAARERWLAADDLVVADARTDLALLMYLNGNIDRSLDLARRAYAVRRTRLGPSNPDLGLSESIIAWCLMKRGLPREADRYFALAVSNYERARVQSEIGPSRLRYRPMVSAARAANLLALGRETEAWGVLERGLSIFMLEWLHSAAWVHPGNHDDSPPALPDLREAQRSLPPRAAFVGWLEPSLAGEPPVSAWAYVIRRDGPVHWIRLADSITARPGRPGSLADLRRLLLRDSGWPLALNDLGETERVERQVWAERMAPLTPWLDGVAHLVVIDSKGMEYVPIETWRDSTGSPVVERFTVSYSPSVSVFALLRKRSREWREGEVPRALIVGDPSMPASSEPAKRAAGARTLSGFAGLGKVSFGTPRGRALAPDDTGDAMAPLPWARSELDAVSSTFTDRVVLRGAAASERGWRAAVDPATGARFDVVHFAAHTVQDRRRRDNVSLRLEGSTERPDRSGSRGDPGEAADGWLTSDEVGALRVDVDLVTLSACSTAGFSDYGGFVGLGDAFLRAGANAVVMSLWEVDDHATSLLMRRFYTELASLRRASPAAAAGAPDRALALARAKRWMRECSDGGVEGAFRHPAYWSGFVLVGDPGR